ncbi:hypothetical protein F4556_001523 [Kitasatospora gansuensis]|uniref:Spore-associated protein A n=1 Tax=Kitasatospora gansuensis TaxID=258050 RepID=A0A7W7WGF8_9ACTN|nr:hypothetical protein [Kitasatospora gansuensis]MBB4945988.1 hypothetical protein [Kitasatospora gansuensis]
MRKAISVLTAALALIISGFTFAPAASAGTYGCGGSLVDTYDVRTSGGTKYGQVNLYYSTADGGTNCAVTIDTYFGSGVSKDMNVVVVKCVAGSAQGSMCDVGDSRIDRGYYSWYAGPVAVTGTASRCVRVLGYIANPSDSSAYASVATSAAHC